MNFNGPGIILAQCVPGQAIVPPEDDMVYAKIKIWINTCKTRHRMCRVGLSGTSYGTIKEVKENPKMPSRIVFVGTVEGDTPYLIETGSNRAEYATLSYYWGARPFMADWPHVTLSSNLAERLAGAPLKYMLLTIEQAILVCQKLGLQYLWVDCLCIVQDDRIDWERESRSMHEIYERSTITIIALGATAIDQGCFLSRKSAHIADSQGMNRETRPVSLTFVADDRYLGLVYVSAPPSPSDFNEILDSVWNTRGWTFPERLLSRRILYFGKNQLLWECQNSRWTDDNTNSFHTNQPARAISNKEEGSLKSNLMGAIGTSATVSDVFETAEDFLRDKGMKRMAKGYFNLHLH